MVAVCFPLPRPLCPPADIVGFTDISASLQPHEVMHMLDRLYRKFDELTEEFNLFKVETIGDGAARNAAARTAGHPLSEFYRLCREWNRERSFPPPSSDGWSYRRFASPPRTNLSPAAYMVVGNLIEEGSSADHTARVARFALAAIQAANSVEVVEGDPSRGHVHIRAGFHAGPVVASVVGRIMPR